MTHLRFAVLTITSFWILACASDPPLNGIWRGVCESGAGKIAVEAAAPLRNSTEERKAKITGMEGDHIVYTGGAVVDGGGNDEVDVSVALAHCIDEGGCVSPAWEYDAEMVGITFTDAAGESPLFAFGFFDNRQKTISGTCITPSGEGAFNFNRK